MMDTNDDGLVSRKEFTRGLIALGVCPLSMRPACDAVFDSWDADGSGALELRELDAKLKRVPPPPSPYEFNAAQRMRRRPPPRPPVVTGMTEQQVQERANAYRAAHQQQLQQQKLHRMTRLTHPPPAARTPPSVAETAARVGFRPLAPAHREAPRCEEGGVDAAPSQATLTVAGTAVEGGCEHRGDGSGGGRGRSGSLGNGRGGSRGGGGATSPRGRRHRRWHVTHHTPAPRKVWQASEVPQMRARPAPPPPQGGGLPSAEPVCSGSSNAPPEPLPEPWTATAAATGPASRGRHPVGAGCPLQRNMEALAEH